MTKIVPKSEMKNTDTHVVVRLETASEDLVCLGRIAKPVRGFLPSVIIRNMRAFVIVEAELVATGQAAWKYREQTVTTLETEAEP